VHTLNDASRSLQLHHLIQPSLQVALQEAALRFQDDSMAEPHELSVTILLLPASASINSSTSSESLTSQTLMESIGKNRNSTSEGRSAAISKQQSAQRLPSTLEVEASGNEDSVETNGTCTSGRNGTMGEVTACVYVSSYKAPEAGHMPSGTKVAVMGPGRRLPLAKVRFVSFLFLPARPLLCFLDRMALMHPLVGGVTESPASGYG
jgi:hypothetical protein